ncbi:NADPH-dependent FMN reductase [Alkalicoccus luteus]|uniref:NAD(P)H-dependent oxidoreductase n=1 Tax=Alkalicoccus luteus TaxID=1237094 RepID=A0A969PTE7_9BACI|nr:NADPH-dependent FMN reductase [Alkalicoccus luteus]NJP39165.1 NAD(P)H-dependent oxidoreductase [Alkalicoccus luteus]
MTKKIAAFCGSLRKESFNKQVLDTMVQLAPDNFDVSVLSIEEIPLYNADIEAEGVPAPVQSFKDQLKAADGIWIVTPEYSASMPGVLKNVLDWAGSMTVENALDQKPVLIAGASPTQQGTAFAQAHLRQTLAACNAYPMQQPQLYIGGVPNKLSGGKVEDEKTNEFLEKAMNDFDTWMETLSK